MIIHNPKVSGSLFFPADSSGNQIILKVENGTLQTIQVDSSGADTGVTPKSDFSGSFTGSFIGDGSNLTGIAASTFNIDLLDAGTIVGDDNLLFSDTSDSGTEKKATFVSGLNSVGVISGSSQVQLGSATGTIDLSTQTNFAVGDTAQIDLILTDDTLTAHIKGGVISGSAQLLNVATDFGSGRVSGEQFGDVAGTSTFTGSFVGDGTSLDGVTSYTDSDNTDHLNSLGVISGSEQLPSGLVSGSSQVNADSITNFDSNVKAKLDADTVISGSSQVNANSITNFDSNVDARMDTKTVISGSSQVVLQSGDKTGFTGATSITTLGTVTAGNVTAILPSGVVSGSDQVNQLASDVNNNTITITAGAGLDGGGSFTLNQNSDETITLTVSDSVISGSSQVDHDATTNFVANEHIDHSGVTIGSGRGLTGGGDITVSRSLTLDTGSNHFNDGVKTKLDAEAVLSGSSHSGDQTFDDNVIITGNLTVSGTTTSVNSNTVNIGDNIIVLNSDESGTPSQDGGIEIERGTSTNVRFQFKESTDRWQFSNDGSTYFNLPTSTADVAEFSNLYYTDTRVKTKLDAETVISGSSQVNANSITNFDSNVKAKLDADGVISGSSQVSLGGFDTDDLSEGSSNLYYTDARVKTKLNADGVISGSSQVTITESQISDLDKYNNTDNTSHLNSLGVISGSSQVNANTISNFDSNVDARMDAKTVISGSSQVDYDNIQNQPTTISSAQATKLSNITITQAVDLDTLESNVSTNNSKTGYTDSLVKTKLDAEGVISGSSQVNANTITNFDSNVKTKLDAEGVISGSSQVTITESQISDLSHYGDSDVVVVLNDNTVISGSSQISLSGFSTTDLSEGTNAYYTDARVKTKLDAEGVISGSSQVNANSVTNFDSNVDARMNAKTVISGSSQVNANTITNFDTNVDDRLNAKTVISGSSQVSLSASDVGLGNVTNESKATMFTSPTFTGNPIAPTQDASNSSTRIATTAFVQGRIDDIIGNAGSTLDTLGELSASLADDQDSLSALTTTVGTKLAKSSNLSDLANASTARDNLGLGTTDNVTFANVNGATGTFTGDVIAYSSSDKRLKDNIEVISNPIEKVQQLKGVTWDWNDNASEIQKSLPNVGVIAQDVEKVLPQLVKDRDNGYKGVDYDKIVGLLIESIKDQQKQIDELKSKLS